MNGGPASGPPRGLRERVPADGAADGARAAGKPAPGKAPGKSGPAAEGGPGTVDFTAALVVAGTAAPPVLPVPLPGEATAAEAAELAAAGAPSRGRPEAEGPRPALPRTALELKLPADLGSGTGRAPAPAVEPREPAPAAPGSPGPATPPALDDRNLGGAVLPRAAHLSLDAGAAGEIGLHLRVRDGIADLRIDGPVAPLVEARSAELRLALAREGLQLGSLELSPGAGDPSRHGASDRPEPQDPRPAAAPEVPSATAAPDTPRGRAAAAAGRVHVEA